MSLAVIKPAFKNYHIICPWVYLRFAHAVPIDTWPFHSMPTSHFIKSFGFGRSALGSFTRHLKNKASSNSPSIFALSANSFKRSYAVQVNEFRHLGQIINREKSTLTG
jgi:hypothetical protein